MAGGFGTRLRPLTNNLPKPMVPMAGRPMMEHVVELLKEHGLIEITSLLYFQPEAVVEHFGDGKGHGVSMDYISLTSDLGTAGSVGNAMREALKAAGERAGAKKGSKKKPDSKKSETTLVISGDVLTDIDLKAALAFHKKKKAMATVVLTRVEDPLSFGIVITEKSGKVQRFLEKPGWGEVFSDTINTGIYILEDKVLGFIPEGVEFDFSKDLFPLLLQKKKPLYGFIADGYWKDVGSLQEYRQANMDILQGHVHVNIPGVKNSKQGVWLGKGAKVDFSSELEGTVVIGQRCRVDAGARIVNSVIGDGSTVEDGAVIIDSVLWEDVRVGRSARLQENVVGSETVISSGAHLGEGAIVSDHCRIGVKSSVKANVKVWPHKEVDDGATLASSLIWGQRWAKKIFSTYGVTGLANLELSPEFAAKLGAAYGAALPKGSWVSTTRDSHKTSRMINRAIMTGILSTGVSVHDYGVIPMPVARLLARGGAEVGGIHTRRSPFEPELVDLKFFDSTGMDLDPGTEKSIENLFFREDFRRVAMDETGEMVFPVHAFETYQSAFLSAIDSEAIRKAAFKVVIDYSYGSSSRIFPSILGSLNLDVVALNANLDPTRITRTGVEFERSLDRLSSIVRSLGAHVGFLLDAGGEKFFMVDEVGDVLDGETALDLVTLLVLKTSKARAKEGTVAVPVTASRAVDVMASSYGFKVVRTKTTSRGIMEAAAAEGALFVGEETGGFIFPEFQPAFDGMFAVVKTLEMLATEGTLPHKLIREIPPSVMVRERVPCAWESKGMIMRRLAEDSRGKKTTLIDGIRINFGSDWLIAYPSQTSPCFHVVAEASTGDKAQELAARYTEKIRKWQGPAS